LNKKLSPEEFKRFLAKEASEGDSEETLTFNLIALQRELKLSWREIMEMPCAVTQAIEKQIIKEQKEQKKQQEKSKFKK
tara:strand:- start:3620 stop:3856 length:237 start_codon:yes stop_codon:yes gene_type:complete